LLGLKRRRWEFQGEIAATLPVVESACLEYLFLLNAERVSENDYGDVLHFQHGTDSYYIKRFNQTTGLRSWVGNSRLRMERRNLERFRDWGLNVPKVVGYGEDYILSRTLRGLLITAGIERSESLDTIANERRDLLTQPAWLSSVLKQTAEAVATLHRHNFCHNDLFWRNLLIQSNAEGPKVFVIDCPSGAFWPWPLLYKRRIKDLACLDKLAVRHLSRTQRLKFIKHYVAALGCNDTVKQLITDVLKYPARRQKRKQRQRWLGKRAD
jgi:tRNA A-37 threonylcarbamoyl transferase component Bud32